LQVQVINAKGEVTLEKVNVARHRAGVRPKYAPEADGGSSEEEEDDALNAIAHNARAAAAGDGEDAATDRRLQRLQAGSSAETNESSAEDALARRRRRMIQARVEGDEEDEEGDGGGSAVDNGQGEMSLQEEEENAESDGEDDELARRRTRMKALAQQRARTEAIVEELPIGKEEEDDDDPEEEEEEESESEYETDDSSDDEMKFLKPVFVSKSQRVTQLEREAKEKVEEEKALARVEDKKQKIKDSQALVIDVMQAELNDQHMSLMKITDLDDNDETYNEQEEYMAWKVRELKRIKRDRERREKAEAERLEVERLRDMTEDERLAELEKRSRTITNERQKVKQQGKYYHRGAFYMDEEEGASQALFLSSLLSLFRARARALFLSFSPSLLISLALSSFSPSLFLSLPPPAPDVSVLAWSFRGYSQECGGTIFCIIFLQLAHPANPCSVLFANREPACSFG
jgi:microfibrillar-associated protein 1